MSDAGSQANRLAGSSSPYLLLHQHNPVDWYPWGREALDRAKAEDKPIFVSVGYSTCFWCHVMERESFSDESTAELMNRDFVNIKLDREERPDLDEIYMSATQILTGQGGWPNSVFLTPELEPFFAGTYFPPADRPGLPSFRNVLRSMADAWRTRRKDVEEQAQGVARAIRHYLSDRPTPGASLPGPDLADRSLEDLERSFDPQWGGFGAAPKFPSPSNLMLLGELAGNRPRAGEMLTATLDRMARGGIFDQIGGGFHRYATDREWNVPHFEKMLYDNGWLLEAYAAEVERSGDPQAERVLRATADFLAREMTSAEGAFWSALDAETDGEEGAFYVWTRQDLLGVLGEEDYGFLAPLLGFAGGPFFEGESYVLHLPQRLGEQAERRRTSEADLVAQIEPLRRKLMKARSARRRPLTDDKVLSDWNGAAISGLAEAGRTLGDEALVDQAARAAEFILAELRTADGRFAHAWRQGVVHTPALLADFAYFGRGLLALHRATGHARWMDAARELATEQQEALGDPEGGFFVAPEDPDLLVRSRDLFDGAMPSANAIALLNLLELDRLDPRGSWGELAIRALRSFTPVIEKIPQATRTLVVAALRVEPSADDSSSGEVDPSRATSHAVAVSIAADGDGADGAGGFVLRIEIADGWHLYAASDGGDPDPQLGYVPLRVGTRDAEIMALDMPDPDAVLEMPAAGDRDDSVSVYAGSLEVRGRARSTGSRPRLVVSFQACDESRCLAPSELVLGLSDLSS